MKGENSRNEGSKPAAKKRRRVPRAVTWWYKQFQKEGESVRAAWYHAVNRAYEEGRISERTADRLESNPIHQA